MEVVKNEIHLSFLNLTQIIHFIISSIGKEVIKNSMHSNFLPFNLVEGIIINLIS